jgi:hypothetical protein
MAVRLDSAMLEARRMEDPEVLRDVLMAEVELEEVIRRLERRLRKVQRGLDGLRVVRSVLLRAGANHPRAAAMCLGGPAQDGVDPGRGLNAGDMSG